ITLDNAGNCDTMLAHLESLLREKNIPFHSQGNHLSALATDVAYADALSREPIKLARQLVTACRASGQRREAFASIIREGNRNGAFRDGKTLQEVQPIQDVNTRWSSMWLTSSLSSIRYMRRDAVQLFLEHPQQAEIAHYLLTATELRVLQDIQEFLHLPHLVQELLSAEETPTASRALLAYERLLSLLRLAQHTYPKIAHGISASIASLKEYMRYTHQTRAYALAMIVNPSIKIAFLEANWTPDEQSAAHAWAEEAV
ncbi:hypothetical protein BV20DRAFT_913619, partial [Pilatotrama ljubarskyi]